MIEYLEYLDEMPRKLSINAFRHLGVRPLCKCCGGGALRGRRGRYTKTKAASRRRNVKSRRSHPRYKDHRWSQISTAQDIL